MKNRREQFPTAGYFSPVKCGDESPDPRVEITYFKSIIFLTSE